MRDAYQRAVRRDLEIDLLRAFVAVAAHRNFTRAAASIGRTQSAVSLQIRRLEEIVGQALFRRTRQSVAITRAGETLLVYAGRILRTNDEALAELARPEADGLVRIGAPDDYATCLLPGILAEFTNAHPRVRVEVSCDNGADLLPRLDRGELDLVVATHPVDRVAGQAVRREPLHWVASPRFVHDPVALLPLVLFPGGCVCRAIALRALDQVDRPWSVAYSTRSLAVIQSALEQGAGVSVMEASTIPKGLRILDGAAGLPPLQDVIISVHGRPSDVPAAVAIAREFIVDGLKSGARRDADVA